METYIPSSNTKITKWLVINHLQIATNKLNCVKNNLKCRRPLLKFLVWIAFRQEVQNRGSCPLDIILSSGYLANHCLCFWTTNFIHWLAVHWIRSLQLYPVFWTTEPRLHLHITSTWCQHITLQWSCEIRDYYMTFSISALVSARDSHIKPNIEAGGLIPGMIWKISCHNLFITYFTLTFILQKRSLNWQIAKINP
jgi:hypothetical protein